MPPTFPGLAPGFVHRCCRFHRRLRHRWHSCIRQLPVWRVAASKWLVTGSRPTMFLATVVEGPRGGGLAALVRERLIDFEIVQLRAYDGFFRQIRGARRSADPASSGAHVRHHAAGAHA